MRNYMFRITLRGIVIALILAGCAAPAQITKPTNAVPTAVNSLPFTHTVCAKGVDLTNQTVSFYHILNPNDQVATVYDPLRAGYADAAEYFNAHGGICGATLEQVFDDSHWGSVQTVDDLYSVIDPKPVVITLYGSGDAEQ